MEECRPGWCECLPRPGVWRLAGGWPALGPPPPPPRPGPAHTSSGLQTRGCVPSVTHSVLTVWCVVCVCECGGCSPVSVCRLCAGRCTSLAWLGWAGWAGLGGLGGRRGDCSLLASRCCPRHQPGLLLAAAGCCWHVITAAQSVRDRAVHGSRLHHRHGSTQPNTHQPPVNSAS